MSEHNWQRPGALLRHARAGLLAAGLLTASPFIGSAMLARAAGLSVTVPAGGNIPAAVAQVGAAGGGTVTLAAGTYNLTAPIVIQSNTTIVGQGASTVIVGPPSPHSWAMIQNASEGLTNLSLQNFVLDGNIPPGAYLTTPSGEDNPYSGMGVYLFAYTYAITNVTIANVEIRNTAQGILTGTVNNLVLQNDYIHDNNPGSFAHNAYLVATSNVTITHSRFDNAHGGDGLHFDFGASTYTITKSEFSGNAGEGILDEGNTGIVVQDSILNSNGQDGLDTFSNNSLQQRLLSSNNLGYGFDHIGGSGAFNNVAALANVAGNFNILGLGGYGTTLTNTLTALTPNRYLAILATGPLGVTDTADWTTQYSGTSSIGAVDFNANHLSNGLLTFTNIGVVGSKTYPVTFRYSAGSGKSLSMLIYVNGTFAGTLVFPATGNWSSWSTITASLNLNDGPNSIALRPQAAGAPELDYLQVNTAVPAPPAPVCIMFAEPMNPYANVMSWVPVAGVSGYAIYRSAAGSSTSRLIATGLTSTLYVDTNILVGNSSFSYNIVAYNAGGATNACHTVSATTPVDAPAGLQAASASGGISLNWMSANGATSYNLKRTTGTGTYTTIASVANTTNLTSTNFEQTYTDASAQTGQTYTYVVSSVSAGGESANSYAVTVTR